MSRVRVKNACIAFGLGLYLAAIGCSESAYKLAPVRGRVTIDGQPLAQGRVVFAPVAQGGGVDAGKSASGGIQPDGTFVLGTYGDADGAIVGDHWVTILNTQPASNGLDSKPTPVVTRKQKFERITFPRTTVSVVAGEENDFMLEMTSQEIARFGT